MAQTFDDQFCQLCTFALASLVPLGAVVLGLVQCKRKKKPDANAGAAKPGGPSKSKMGAAPGAPPPVAAATTGGATTSADKKDEKKEETKSKKDDPKL